MKFMISRTSVYEDVAPCEEAYKANSIFVDQRTFKTPEEYDRAYNSPNYWISFGQNHRVTEVGIARDISTIAWCVDFDDLSELMRFVSKYGDCVLNDDSIEIYDDYRE